MTFELNRRDLLAAGAALGLASGVAPAQAKSAPKYGWQPPTEARQKALTDMAVFGPKKAVSSKDGVAVCTHPLATAAAIDMLKMGGTAADAICAASIAQCVVEPHMTTLSGVFSMLYYEAATGKTTYTNGTMNAPKSHPIFESKQTSLAALLGSGSRNGTLCPVPGYWGGFEASHDRYGKLDRKTVMAPAIHYARNGFDIHPFLWGEMFVEHAGLGVHPEAREIYFDNGRLLNTGETLVQSRHADMLERLAEEGSDYFYRGEWAQNYAKAVQAAGGFVTEEDMASYKPMFQDAVRGTYRGFEMACAPAPDFGGQALIEMMNLVELMDIQKLGPAFESPETVLKFMQIIGSVYADSVGERWSGNITDVEKAISKDYAAERFAKLSTKPRSPYDGLAVPPGSNHVTVVDGEGNVATVLHSVMSLPYTTKIWVDGVYACAGLVHLVSGLPDREKRRVHSRICPNMFLKDGKPVLASGSPSVSLTENIVQTSTAILDFGLDIETAVHKPRYGGALMTNLSSLTVEHGMASGTADHARAAGAIIEEVSPWFWASGSFDGVAIAADGTASACGDPRRTAHAFAV